MRDLQAISIRLRSRLVINSFFNIHKRKGERSRFLNLIFWITWLSNEFVRATPAERDFKVSPKKTCKNGFVGEIASNKISKQKENSLVSDDSNKNIFQIIRKNHFLFAIFNDTPGLLNYSESHGYSQLIIQIMVIY